MSQEGSERPTARDDGAERPKSSAPEGGPGPGPELDRLPPPAFPPGSRRSSVHEARVAVDEEEVEEGDDDFPRDAFISPDDPIRREGRGVPDDAFISPDDPLVPRERHQEGTVTGMGEAEVETADFGGSGRRQQKPTIHELPYLLDQLAERIHESGSRALEVHAEMGHFQAALRSFLKGYLEGSAD